MISCTYFDLGKTRVISILYYTKGLIHCSISGDVAKLGRDYNMIRVRNGATTVLVETETQKGNESVTKGSQVPVL
jgi:hypothetical protein